MRIVANERRAVVKIMIEIWGEDSVQAMLEGSKRNKDVFNKIAHKMEVAGYEKTAELCNSKIRRL